MKNYTLILFVFLYFIALLKPIAPFIEYGINKDYIAKVLCINKDKPKLHCEGKCYLNKQLKKADEESKNNQPITINLNDYPVALLAYKEITFQQYSSIVESIFFYKNNYSSNFYFNIFHPPMS